MSRSPSEPLLVLASASPRRQELLRLLGLPFVVRPSRVEEVLPETHPAPEAFGIRLAAEKARDVAREAPGALVIGADTLVTLEDRLYGKPIDEADAARILRELSGRTHRVITAVAVLDGRTPEAALHTFATTTAVTFRELEEPEIAAYVATGEPMDKAGGYAIQGHGALLVREICGDYPNVVGLPVMPLALLLRRLGLPILWQG